MRADNLFGTGENLFESHGRGVEDDGVCRRLEGGFGTMAVAVVTLLHLANGGLFSSALFKLGGPTRSNCAKARQGTIKAPLTNTRRFLIHRY